MFRNIIHFFQPLEAKTIMSCGPHRGRHGPLWPVGRQRAHDPVGQGLSRGLGDPGGEGSGLMKMTEEAPGMSVVPGGQWFSVWETAVTRWRLLSWRLTGASDVGCVPS